MDWMASHGRVHDIVPRQCRDTYRPLSSAASDSRVFLLLPNHTALTNSVCCQLHTRLGTDMHLFPIPFDRPGWENGNRLHSH
jgi:hypothetical protein